MVQWKHYRKKFSNIEYFLNFQIRFFSLFFTEVVWQLLVANTNLNAAAKHTGTEQWSPVSLEVKEMTTQTFFQFFSGNESFFWLDYIDGIYEIP